MFVMFRVIAESFVCDFSTVNWSIGAFVTNIELGSELMAPYS
jgi:hypothetical protein